MRVMVILLLSGIESRVKDEEIMGRGYNAEFRD